ncbi:MULTISPECIES: hypothetical protein [Streptomyces]|uniref:Uncharacterized protein n=1 Tax=Streptomyces tsukubensis (strain DSM 42081 / NBRC 108919 / NRRL 18488 / 9993) TaxID=1114943 RepID=I2MT39_STRT9|nr:MULTISPECIES: hypothetical protein [Streptomyces]AZK98782.1 hypothetical protein B7R87_33005 [Streptomyces tsukubensis]EIF87936.1 replication protein [Streptomyces tsukubensis NRRL18488]MYS65149.1 hypothetical protein [Streptomyces sp. SID5473]QKM65789.1 hypothetical protein STSU_000100 [Streptomyces tsukubensis NRRL18488]
MPKRNPPGKTVTITKAAWYQEVVGDPDHPVPARLAGRQQQILDAMDNGGPDALRTLVESWGLVWKVGPRGGLTVDVLDAMPDD